METFYDFLCVRTITETSEYEDGILSRVQEKLSWGKLNFSRVRAVSLTQSAFFRPNYLRHIYQDLQQRNLAYLPRDTDFISTYKGYLLLCAHQANHLNSGNWRIWVVLSLSLSGIFKPAHYAVTLPHRIPFSTDLTLTSSYLLASTTKPSENCVSYMKSSKKQPFLDHASHSSLRTAILEHSYSSPWSSSSFFFSSFIDLCFFRSFFFVLSGSIDKSIPIFMPDLFGINPLCPVPSCSTLDTEAQSPSARMPRLEWKILLADGSEA